MTPTLTVIIILLAVNAVLLFKGPECRQRWKIAKTNIRIFRIKMMYGRKS